MAKSLSPKTWIKLSVLLLFVGSAIVGILQSPTTAYFSSPHEIRRTESLRVWDPTFRPPPGFVPAKPYRLPIATSTLKEGILRIESKTADATSGVTADIRVINAGQNLQANIRPDLTISLRGLAVLWPDRELLSSEERYVPAQFIHPHTHEPKDDAIPKEGYGTPSFYLSGSNAWPEVMFALETSNYEDFRWLGFRLLNAVNHTSLSSGSSYHHAKISRMSTRFEAWHNPPFFLAVDFAYGPAESRMLKMEPGAVALFSQAKVELNSLHRGKWSQGGRSMGSGKVTQTLTLRSPKDKQGHAGILNYAPKEFGTRLQCRLPDGSSPFVHTSDGFAFWSSSEKLPEDEIELRFLPNYGRIIFELPPLPGGPNNGVPIENLFDVRIPYLEARSSYQLLEIIRKSTDLSTSLRAYSSGTSDEFDNATIAELLEHYRLNAGIGRVSVDQTNHELINPPSFWKRVQRRLGL